MLILLILLIAVIAFTLGAWLARWRLLADLELARRRARAADQAAISEVLRIARGRP